MSVSTEVSVKLTPEQVVIYQGLSDATQRQKYAETIHEEGVIKAASRIAKRHGTEELIEKGILPPKGETREQFKARLGL